MKKISICTVCMNRLVYLQKTLPANINENKDYPNVEFIVLDYNSKDGMETWMRSAMMKHIESGVLKYYKTYEPVDFNLSHSKNMATLLSTGDFIALVDADNYAGKNYVEWLNSAVIKHGDNSIITTLRKSHIPFRDQGGKLCCHHDLLRSVHGFDESLVGYGMDDVDLVNRLERAGGRRIFIENPEMLRYIGHNNDERMKNQAFTKSLESLYWHKPNSKALQNHVLYLFRDKTFIQIEYFFSEALKDNMILAYGGWAIGPDGRSKGTYEKSPGYVSLQYDNGVSSLYHEDDAGNLNHITDKGLFSWQNIHRHNELFIELVMGYGECLNRITYSENDQDLSRINRNGYGKGVVYLNFDKTTPIKVGSFVVKI